MKNGLKLLLLATSFFACFTSTAKEGSVTNLQLIEAEVLGQQFCYVDDARYGWIFTLKGEAVRHGFNLGMPGPDDFYKIKSNNAPRSLGHFELQNAHGSLLFALSPEGLLHEYSTGQTLTTEACHP